MESGYRLQSRGRLRIRCLLRSTLPHSRFNPLDLRPLGVPYRFTWPYCRVMVKIESGGIGLNTTCLRFQPGIAGIRAMAFILRPPKTRASAKVPSGLWT